MHLKKWHRGLFAFANIIGTVLILLCQTPSFSQQFGGSSPTKKWLQIDTDTVRVIYPEGVEDQAQRVANTIHYLSKNSYRSVGKKVKKLDIVLQNQTVVSNGYVGLAPFRSEFYLTQPQNSRSIGSNWLDVLAIHEYRHAQQFSNSRKGLTKFAYILSGELGWSYFSSLSLPDWFMEGDAVVAETSLTAQGRGRIPSFYKDYKSLYQDDIYYDYQKSRNGSIKDFVPNHYRLGYMMCNYGRETFGNDVWKDVLSDAGKYKGLFYPFSGGLKNKTEYPTNDLYVLSLRHYYSNWDSLKYSDNEKEIEQLNNVDKVNTFTTYKYPYFDDENNVIVYKSSFKEIGAFYRINRYGTELIIRRQGRVLDNYFSYKDEKLVWAEIGQDERWGWETYSNLIYYDIATDKRKKITSASKYFSPDISNDGKSIVAFHSDELQKYSLHILNIEDGELIKKIPNPGNLFFSYPKWSKDGKSIVAIAREVNGRNAIVSIDIETGKLETITDYTFHQLGIPWLSDEYIYYSASYSGIDNIYAVSLSEGKIYQLTDVVSGAYFAAYNEKKNRLYYSEFTALGDNIKMKSIDHKNWKEVEIVEPVDMEEYDFNSNEEEGGDITDSIPSKIYPTKKYSASSKLINIHSWSPYFNDPNYEFALRSNNILNTLNMNLGVRYNRNDENIKYFLEFVYAQLYPVFSLSANVGKRKGLKKLDNGSSVEVAWWENVIQPEISFPFDISSGLYTRGLNFSANYSYTSIKFEDNENVNTTDFNLNASKVGMAFLNVRKKAKQNIFSKYGQYINLSYNGSLDDNVASQAFFDSEFTFPGFSANHNIVIQGAYQQEDADNDYRFGDNFLYARGYNRPLYDFIYKAGVNYHMPVFYPDWGFWGIAYLYRLRANIFYDYSRAHLVSDVSNTESIQLYNSVGGELVLDTRLLNLYDFSFGFRYSYLLNEDPQQYNLKHSYEFFIPLLRF